MNFELWPALLTSRDQMSNVESDRNGNIVACLIPGARSQIRRVIVTISKLFVTLLYNNLHEATRSNLRKQLVTFVPFYVAPYVQYKNEARLDPKIRKNSKFKK